MNYTAAPAAADDDNVFYDYGREGRKIAHYSTFRKHQIFICNISKTTV